MSLHPGATEILHASPAEVISRFRPVQPCGGDARCARGYISSDVTPTCRNSSKTTSWSQRDKIWKDHRRVKRRCLAHSFCKAPLSLGRTRLKSQTFTFEQLGFHFSVCRFVSSTLSSKRTANDSRCAISSHVRRTEDGCTCFPGATP